ncbi:hypothetical protein F5884DRAFT_803926 [Xylogone sp. PMI_703]|nr:hypothetical protein F5884DRAFT_803926 [Xylogone sp. PMI_703]
MQIASKLTSIPSHSFLLLWIIMVEIRNTRAIASRTSKLETFYLDNNVPLRLRIRETPKSTLDVGRPLGSRKDSVLYIRHDFISLEL